MPVLLAKVGKERVCGQRRSSRTSAAGSGPPPHGRGLRPVTTPEYEFDVLPAATRRAVGVHGHRRGAADPGARGLDNARGAARRVGHPGGARDAGARGAAASGRRARARRRPRRAGGRHARRRPRRPRTVRASPTRSSSSEPAGSSRRSSRRSWARRSGETRAVSYELGGRRARARSRSPSSTSTRRCCPRSTTSSPARRPSSTRSRSCAPTSRAGSGQQWRRRSTPHFRAAAVDELVRASNVQGAGPLVETRARELLNGFVRSLANRGIAPEAYFQVNGPDARGAHRPRCAPRRRSRSPASWRSRRSPSKAGIEVTRRRGEGADPRAGGRGRTRSRRR